MQKLKQKVLDVVWVVGLGLCVGFCLLQIELIGWQTLVSLEYEWLYGNMATVQVDYHHQETYENFIRWHFGSEWKTALAIATAENGTHACDRIHTNKDGSKDIGIFQINQVHAKKGNLYDCRDNVRVAAEIYNRQGWSPWTVYKTGAYKKFLTN